MNRSRNTTQRGGRARPRVFDLVIEAVIAALVLGLFILKITNYADPNMLRPSVIARDHVCCHQEYHQCG